MSNDEVLGPGETYLCYRCVREEHECVCPKQVCPLCGSELTLADRRRNHTDVVCLTVRVERLEMQTAQAYRDRRGER